MTGGVQEVLCRAVNAWAEQFDGPEDEDLSVSGGDLVDFFTAWRKDAKQAVQALRFVIDTLEAWEDDAARNLRRCKPADEARHRNVRDNYRALLVKLRGQQEPDPTMNHVAS